MKPKFKVGDKVKFCDSSKHKIGDVTGKIIEIDRRYHLRVKWNTNNCYICGHNRCGMVVSIWSHLPEYLEHVVVVGQQLLFDFAKEE